MQEKLCHTIFLPTALPVGVFRLRPSSGGISPLTCTIFDPTYFGSILRNHVFHISPTRLKYSIMGNYFDFGLKIAHRGNTGSHRGKRKLLSLSENYICALLPFFFCFLVYGIKPILPFLMDLNKNLLQNKNSTCNLFCSELTSHTTKEISSASSPVFCRMYPSP